MGYLSLRLFNLRLLRIVGYSVLVLLVGLISPITTSAYVLEHYDSNVVNSIAYDEQYDRFWAATPNGILNWSESGSSFDQYTALAGYPVYDAQLIIVQYVTWFKPIKWIVANDLLFRFDDAHTSTPSDDIVTVYTTDVGLPPFPITSIDAVETAVVIGTLGGGLALLHHNNTPDLSDDTWQYWTTDDGLASNNVIDVALGQYTNQWAACTDSTASSINFSWANGMVGTISTPFEYQYVAFSPHYPLDRLYAVTHDDGMAAYYDMYGNPGNVGYLSADLTGANLQDFSVDYSYGRERLFFASEDTGVRGFIMGYWGDPYLFNTSNHLPSDKSLAVTVIGYRTLVGTDKGAAVIHDRATTNPSDDSVVKLVEENQPPSFHTTVIASDTSNNKWFGFQSGLGASIFKCC